MDEEIDPEIILTFDDYVTRYGPIDATTDPHDVAVRIVDEDIENQSPKQKMNEKQREVTIAEYERLVPLYIKYYEENKQQAQAQDLVPQHVRDLFGHNFDFDDPNLAGPILEMKKDLFRAAFSESGSASASVDAASISGLTPPDATGQFAKMLKSCGLDSPDTEAYEEFMKLLKLKLIDSQHPLNQTMMDVFSNFMTTWTGMLKKLLYTKTKGKFTPTPDDTESYKNALLCTAQSFFKKRATASGFHDRMTTRVAIFNTDRPETLLDRAKKIDMFVITVSALFLMKNRRNSEYYHLVHWLINESPMKRQRLVFI